MSDTLHPQVAAIAELRRKLRETRVLDANALRKQVLLGIEVTNAGGPVVEQRRELMVPRPNGGEAMRIVLNAPASSRGLCVYFHGGGFVICSPESHDKIARTIAVEARCTVASVDYRMGPEHPYPAAHDDALDAAHWLMDMANALSGSGRVVFAGDSAGGNLALTAAQWAIANGRTPAGVLLLYPYLRRDSESRRRYGPDDRIIDDEVIGERPAHRRRSDPPLPLTAPLL